MEELQAVHARLELLRAARDARERVLQESDQRAKERQARVIPTREGEALAKTRNEMQTCKTLIETPE